MVQRCRFNFIREAQIWYSRVSDQRTLSPVILVTGTLRRGLRHRGRMRDVLDSGSRPKHRNGDHISHAHANNKDLGSDAASRLRIRELIGRLICGTINLIMTHTRRARIQLLERQRPSLLLRSGMGRSRTSTPANSARLVSGARSTHTSVTRRYTSSCRMQINKALKLLVLRSGQE